MRLILTAGALALALAACSKNNQADTTQNVDENLTAENIVSNDVTAIDAVTADAANMAADVDLNFGNLGNGMETDTNDAAPRAKKSTSRPPSPTQAPDEPMTNSGGNAAE